jgi:hypothetical protein
MCSIKSSGDAFIFSDHKEVEQAGNDWSHLRFPRLHATRALDPTGAPDSFSIAWLSPLRRLFVCHIMNSSLRVGVSGNGVVVGERVDGG